MTRIIMCGCNGAMGRMITGIVRDDSEAEIVAGIDMTDNGQADFPVFSSISDCDIEADAIIDFSTPKILTEILTYSKQHKVRPCSARRDTVTSSWRRLKLRQPRRRF